MTERLTALSGGGTELFAQFLQDISSSHAACRARLSIDQIVRIMDSGCKSPQAIESHIEMMRDDLYRSDAEGPINPSLFLDQSFGLPDQMLTKVDVTSMAHSLEVRVPLLDHRMVEFAASLPEEMKQKGFGPNCTKKIIRLYLKQRFPDSFINRHKKGFGMPVTCHIRTRIKRKIRSEISRCTLDLPANMELSPVIALLENPELSSNALWGWRVSELSTPKWKKVEASFSCGFCQLGLTYLFTVCL